MYSRKTILVILSMVLFLSGPVLAQTVKDNWNDFLHYTKIGRLDLAKGYAQVVLESNPEPVELLALSEENPQGYEILLRVVDTASDAELVELSGKLLDVIEEGRFARRSDPKIITDEIRRLGGTSRAQLAAVERLKNAGEYAIVYIVDAIADNSRREELPNIVWALSELGRDAIRPLAAALQTKEAGVKAEIIKAMGNISYPQSLAYLKYIVEKDSSAELRDLASNSISQIDPGALKLPAAQLFYRLGENYYYHADSLAPAEDADFANIWFWDAAGKKLVSEKVDKSYFNELMAMRSCEWALRADAGYGMAVGLWQAAYFKAESAGIEMPSYFGPGHADAGVYATTAGAEYLHQALARAIRDKNAYVALQAIEALASTAGEKSLLYRVGVEQPLVQALTFNNKAVRYSAAIAIGSAGPKENFAENKLVTTHLASALGETSEGVTEESDLWNAQSADNYALRAAQVMLRLVLSRNPVINLASAQSALINGTKDKRPQIQVLSGQVLAGLESPDAQRSIAAMALAETNSVEVRIYAFNSLSASAKLNANLLEGKMIDAIYSLVSSTDIDPQLRSAAAAAFGALNLPSERVKDLILDQAKS